MSSQSAAGMPSAVPVSPCAGEGLDTVELETGGRPVCGVSDGSTRSESPCSSFPSLGRCCMRGSVLKLGCLSGSLAPRSDAESMGWPTCSSWSSPSFTSVALALDSSRPLDLLVGVSERRRRVVFDAGAPAGAALAAGVVPRLHLAVSLLFAGAVSAVLRLPSRTPLGLAATRPACRVAELSRRTTPPAETLRGAAWLLPPVDDRALLAVLGCCC
mmetsp:Transcript_97524/g.193156  ORF Transcript_97524/g.193156 Transcript_97524/m.193156 type:complete len:215 (-) Transcript_97524:161-805(-)